MTIHFGHSWRDSSVAWQRNWILQQHRKIYISSQYYYLLLFTDKLADEYGMADDELCASHMTFPTLNMGRAVENVANSDELRSGNYF